MTEIGTEVFHKILMAGLRDANEKGLTGDYVAALGGVFVVAVAALSTEEINRIMAALAADLEDKHAEFLEWRSAKNA
jgi:hypothetical protein